MISQCFKVMGSFALFGLCALTVQKSSASPAVLTAPQVIEKNVAARGGLKTWHNVATMSLSGTLGAGGNQRATIAVPGDGSGHSMESLRGSRPTEEVKLPFLMELKRPHKSRFEIVFAGQTAYQVFDGSAGWKFRPYLNRRVLEPYTPEEMQKALQETELEGRLVDYQAKGTRAELDGTEQVEGHDTYELKLTLKDGRIVHEWIDAQTFLESKMEGMPRRLDGADHPVEIYLRDYREVSGVMVPFLVETRVLPIVKTATGFRDTPVPAEKLVIEKVVVNPKLDDKLFSKPTIEVASLTK